MGFRGFDSSTILILMGGIPRPIGDFPESLIQAMLVGTLFLGGLGVLDCFRPGRTAGRLSYVLLWVSCVLACSSRISQEFHRNFIRIHRMFTGNTPELAGVSRPNTTVERQESLRNIADSHFSLEKETTREAGRDPPSLFVVFCVLFC